MTPRTIETEFAQLLANQSEEHYPLDLGLEAPIMNQIHPKLIWAKLQFERNLPLTLPHIDLDGRSYQCFSSRDEATNKFSNIDLKFVGRPWSLKKFLDENHSEAIIDFPPLGTIVLSRNSLGPHSSEATLPQILLPLWMSYALSPELWGAQGKWTRFHSRIFQLLNEKQLMNGTNVVGHYQLNEKAKILENYGFIGTLLEKSYVLVLPWTFSLSALNKLEETIRQEF